MQKILALTVLAEGVVLLIGTLYLTANLLLAEVQTAQDNKHYVEE